MKRGNPKYCILYSETEGGNVHTLFYDNKDEVEAVFNDAKSSSMLKYKTFDGDVWVKCAYIAIYLK